MKIVHLLFSFTTGGAELLVTDLANYQSAGHNVCIIIVNDKIDRSLIDGLSQKVKIIELNRKEGSVNPFKLFKLWYLIRNLNPDVIHCHHEGTVGLLPLVKSKKLLTIHDVGRATKKMNRYNVKVAISSAVYADIVKRSDHEIKPVIINNGIDLESIKYNRSLNFDDTIHLVQISRLEHEKKGQDILIKALHLLKTKYAIPNISLSIIGTGSSLEYLTGLINELDLANEVKIIGLKNRKWIYDNLKNFSILVQPSRYEGFGLTVIEAMAAKIPCLVSNIDGPINIIDNGKYGFFFESGSIESCAGAINEILQFDIEVLNRKVENTYRYALEHYSSIKMNENYLEAYLS